MVIDAFSSDIEVLRELGHRVKAHRVQMQLTQKDFARKIGVHPLTLMNLEAGRGVTAITLIHVMRGLGETAKINRWIEDPPLSPELTAKLQGDLPKRVSYKRKSKS